MGSHEPTLLVFWNRITLVLVGSDTNPSDDEIKGAGRTSLSILRLPKAIKLHGETAKLL